LVTEDTFVCPPFSEEKEKSWKFASIVEEFYSNKGCVSVTPWEIVHRIRIRREKKIPSFGRIVMARPSKSQEVKNEIGVNVEF